MKSLVSAAEFPDLLSEKFTLAADFLAEMSGNNSVDN